VLWTEGRIDFAALQRRLYPGASRADQLSVEMPAAYVAFDLLAVDGTDIRPKPYSARRALLEDLFARQPPTRSRTDADDDRLPPSLGPG
jgi:ATP-dependent DNA ligase